MLWRSDWAQLLLLILESGSDWDNADIAQGVSSRFVMVSRFDMHRA
jgi:hypothetical protein